MVVSLSPPPPPPPPPPPRHRGGPTVVTRSRSKSPQKKLVIHKQPGSSPFSTKNSPTAKVVKSPAVRRASQVRSRASPLAKYPLSLSTTSELNAPIATANPPVNSTRVKSTTESPAARHAMQRTNRAGIGVENSTPENALNRGSPVKGESPPSPLKHGRGSPVPKRRMTGYRIHSSSPLPGPSRSSSRSRPTRSPTSSTPRRISIRANTSKAAQTDKPTYAKSRPQAQNPEFATPSDPASKVRRVTSVENLFIHGSLPSASAHPHRSTLTKRLLAKESIATGKPGKSPGTEWVTPQNYKNAKPDPAAFHSTGFVPKRGRLSTDSTAHHQPDTPCKRPPSYSVAPMSGLQTASAKYTDFPSPAPASKSNGTFNLLRQRESVVFNHNEASPTAGLGSNSISSGELELPPTPTKVYTNASLFGNVGGTKRKGVSRPQSPYSVGGRATRARLRESPQTPTEQISFPDPSHLSIHAGARKQKAPQTPAKDYFSMDVMKSNQPRTPANLPLESSPTMQVSPSMSWSSRFSEVRLIGSGEFSQVYLAVEVTTKSLYRNGSNSPNRQLASPRVSSPFEFSSPESKVQIKKLYAVKKSKTPYMGVRDRDRRLEEVRILRELGKHEHVVQFVDNWEEDRYLYIQTEYCEGGSLDKLLDRHGAKGRLDEFRVWKIMIELLQGIKHIHDCNFMHLDIKPANVLITSNGTLRISDFGMATRCPAPPGIEREGDREYIAPEVIQTGKYDKPVDIFSLGLTVIEIAGNEALPPNGPVWQSLRSGDLSGAPILSTSVAGEFVVRDLEGNPINTELLGEKADVSASLSFSSDSSNEIYQPSSTGLLSPSAPRRKRAFYRTRSGSKKLLHDPRPGDMLYPPKFMEDGGLERIVQSMLAPNPADRPTAAKLLTMPEIKWVERSRQAPATMYEGLWGPELPEQVPLGRGDSTLELLAAGENSGGWDLIE
ncbi:hypothetical protein BDZ91DRAFT_116401 [Kalaharituber pfeilii]|nr:hypothetical protein BDZ91DRAFT_116401 [Kalaharituber pfeilii]